MSTKSTVIARLTITHKNDSKTVIEIHSDAGYRDFYRWYKRAAGKRNKVAVRTADRNDVKDLAALAIRLEEHFQRQADYAVVNQNKGVDRKAVSHWDELRVIGAKIVILQKRAYKRMLESQIQDLPGYKPVATGPQLPARWVPDQRKNPYRGSYLGHTSLQRKMNIITGRR